MVPQTPAGILLLYSAVHIACHFGAFVALRLRSAWLQSEKGIFLLHVVSAAALAAAALLTVAFHADGATLGAAGAGVFAHGIYSLTFLEFWSLSQISYSRDVLLIARSGRLPVHGQAPEELLALGERKRAGRLRALERLGLVESAAGAWRVTPKGRMVSGALRLLQWLSNLRMHG